MKMIIQMIGLFVLLSMSACNPTEPRLEPDLKLELKDISCTEVWLQLTTDNIQLPTTINVLKNNSVAQTFSLSKQDTLLYIDSLLPNQNYKFRIVLNSTNSPQPTTNEVLAQTMDTTSHNFTFEIFIFGENGAGSSTLYDVAIIDENNIWAVGEIYMNDSLGNPDLTAYNAGRWNGQIWELKRINMQSSCNPVTYPPLKSIWAFSANNIVVTSGGSIGWFDGNSNRTDCGIRSILTGSINKLWGSNSYDLYAVGSNGNIANYNGSSWTKIESGTEFYLADIAGNNNGEIYIIGNRSFLGQGLVLKSSNGVNFSTIIESANISESQIFKPKLFGSLTSVWVDQSNAVYTAGDLFYQYKFNKWNYIKSFPGNHYGGNQNAATYGYFTGIDGNSSNDMWIIGERNTVRHFNGVTWQQIGLPYDRMSDIIWLDLEVKGTMVAIVGMKGNKAFLMIAKR